MTIEKIPLNKENRMLRIGFGKHENVWFIRIDLWTKGFRIKFNKKNKK